MISTDQALLLALLQGVTEFLPISSSGHLVLMPYFLDWPDQGVAFDVAVHVGTLLAVVSYLRRDIGTIVRDMCRSLVGTGSADSRVGWLVVVATIPAVLAGIWIDPVLATNLRQPLVIATSTAGFAVLLLFADLFGSKRRNMHDFGWRDALIIGVAQAVALVPGTSRAGITMTAALALGSDRRSAARFSFLLSIPVILAAGTFKGLELGAAGVVIYWPVFATGVLVACASSWLIIALFLRWIERMGMLPFVVYRLALGILLVLWFR